MRTLTTENFPTYLRTKMFWRSRLRDVDIFDDVFVHKDQLKQVDLKALEAAKEIVLIYHTVQNAHKSFYHVPHYVPLKAGPIAPYLLEPQRGQQLDSLTTKMRSYLQMVSLKEDSGSTDYFNLFLELKNQYLNLFFTVDLFSGRVHTPVSSFKREYRPNILIEGEQTSSLDVSTMQPTLLGKILEIQIGINEYSEWINEGRDIYLIIQNKEKLDSRDNAKKRFYEILFSKPNKQLAELFGNANWINWINEIKSKPLKANPRTQKKQHSNLAWLLQTSEVKIMREVWQGLVNANIFFLSVHDEVIIKVIDAKKAEEIFNNVLTKHFKFYKLNSKG